MTSSPQIGTLQEGPLHAALKAWCAQPGDRFEVAIDRYVIDVVRDDLLIEIQTGGFSAVRKKLRRLLGLGYEVRIIHPIPATKTIVRLGADGEILGRRKSPKRGTRLDVFSQLVYITELLVHPGLHIRVVLTNEDEYRKHDPGRAYRRKGWVVEERRLTGVDGTIDLADAHDLAGLLPDGLPDRFTTADVSRLSGCPRRVAQQATYCLRQVGVIEVCGKQGNAIEYGRLPSAPSRLPCPATLPRG